jgi:enterochelin esterase-like enzyme
MTKPILNGTFIVMVLCNAQAQDVFPYREGDASASPRISTLRQAAASGNSSAVDDFWAEMQRNGTPLVERIPGDDRHSLVTFLWQGSVGTHNVSIINGINGAEPKRNQMMQVSSTDVWYKSYEIRNDARFTYAFSPNDPLQPLVDPARTLFTFQRDPLNPRVFPGAYPSFVELPDAPPEPWLARVEGTPMGTVAEQSFQSASLSGARPLWIYRPPGFNTSGERYPLLVLFDGDAYVSTVPTPTILDNLIGEKRIPPVVAVFIGHANRAADLQCSEAFADFVAKELVPWMRQNAHATNDPSGTVVGGSSLGALEASFAGLRFPEVFGNILSLSGSYWWSPRNDNEPEWLTRQFAAAPKLPLRFVVAVGSMEERATQLVTNRHFRDVLNAKGYAVEFQEFNGIHGYLNWRDGLARGIIGLIGR